MSYTRRASPQQRHQPITRRPNPQGPLGLVSRGGSTANLIHFNHGAKQWSGVDEPLRTIAAGGNHVGLIYSYLKQFLGEDLPHLQHPGFESPVVTITYAGTLYILVDIGMRMLTPRELARCQGFPEDYVLTGSKTNQVHKIGNSVSPQAAQAVVQANYPPSLAAVA